MALGALVKGRHGFVGGSDLELEEVGSIAVLAPGGVGALGGGLVDVVPGCLAAEDVVDLLLREQTALDERLVDWVDVRTRSAFKPVHTAVG